VYIINKNEIIEFVKSIDLLPIIKEGFIAYTKGRSVVPPVGELSFKNPPGDVHIKYGYIAGENYYVIKIASGFYENETLGLPNGSGMMLLFDQQTGENIALLADDAYLTDVRTAVAGAICAEQLSNPINCIGVIGTGLQGRFQVQYLKSITDCRQVMVWGRNRLKMEKYKTDMEEEGFTIFLADTPSDVAARANYIVTTTASTEPLLVTNDIQPGTHITAMGSDTPRKQELESGILEKADLVVADSIPQCKERGEIFHALNDNSISENEILELGTVLSGSATGRNSNKDITVADLTGVAVQDIQIATAVFETFLEINNEI